jgi:hypothetical protein
MFAANGEQINLEYLFRLVYDLLHGGHSVSGYAGLQDFFAHLWFWIVIVGYALSILGFAAIVYIMVLIFELRKREEHHYAALIASNEATGGVSPRWQHIESLINESSASHWREAIIEADIMLDDALARQGYVGDGVGEKLKAADQASLHSLQDAWDVHKIRNQIAHEGSAFNLSDSLARRTIQRYETVLRELKAI